MTLTFEAKLTREQFRAYPQLKHLVVSMERLDRDTINLTVEDGECEGLTEFLDDNNIDYRMV